MRSTEHQRARAHARSTITAASVRTDGDISMVQFAIIHRFAQAQDRASYLRLAETLSAFLSRLRCSSKTLDIAERQRIVRLLVKEILVGEDAIIIRHSVPIT